MINHKIFCKSGSRAARSGWNTNHWPQNVICSSYSGKPEVMELHFQPGSQSFSVAPPAMMRGSIRCWCEWIFDAKFACNKQLSSIILCRCCHLVIYNRYCSIPPTTPVHVTNLEVPERYLPIIRGAGTPFPWVQGTSTTGHMAYVTRTYWVDSLGVDFVGRPGTMATGYTRGTTTAAPRIACHRHNWLSDVGKADHWQSTDSASHCNITNRAPSLLQSWSLWANDHQNSMTDMTCYFNVRSKADMSELNLPHGTNNYKVENRNDKK